MLQMYYSVALKLMTLDLVSNLRNKKIEVKNTLSGLSLLAFINCTETCNLIVRKGSFIRTNKSSETVP